MCLIEKAIAIAVKHHSGMIDLAGVPYILHPLRVMSALSGDAAVVGVLHDVVEDCAVSLADLARVFPPHIVSAIDAISKRPEESRAAYYARVKACPLALVVKWADIADNSGRIPALSDPALRDRLSAKYASAKLALS